LTELNKKLDEQKEIRDNRKIRDNRRKKIFYSRLWKNVSPERSFVDDRNKRRHTLSSVKLCLVQKHLAQRDRLITEG
jgi:hypothetical protein